MQKTEVDYKKLREKLQGRYIVQWVIQWDDNNHINQVSGYCVRDKGVSQWPILFRHKEENVCQKVAYMLNEEEHNKC